MVYFYISDRFVPSGLAMTAAGDGCEIRATRENDASVQITIPPLLNFSCRVKSESIFPRSENEQPPEHASDGGGAIGPENFDGNLRDVS
jgi:hypothetical protein